MELRDSEGRTPLALAKDAKMARFMVLKGANLYALDNNQNPAGANPALPDEVRKKVLDFVKQKQEEKQSPITIPNQSPQVENSEKTDMNLQRNYIPRFMLSCKK